MVRLLPIVLLSCITAAPAAPAAADEAWRAVFQEDGIAVSQRDVPGRNLPAFRGVGEVEGGLYHVLGVILDVSKHPIWMYQCTEARYVHQESELRGTVYTRLDLPWPVADRDSVILSVTEFQGDSRAISRFRESPHPEAPVRDDVVRMPTIRGHYALEAIGPERTRVEYQVDADPGGLLPAWIAARASRDNPLRTLQKLRTRVTDTRGAYDAFRARWDPRRAPAAP